MSLDPTHQSLQINLRSDDPAIQGQTLGDTELLFNFNRTIEIPDEYHLNICLASAEIPHSWYTWDQVVYMKVIWYEAAFPYPRQTHFLQLPIRNWTPCCLADYINTLIDNATTNTDFPLISWDSHTLKWTLTDRGSQPPPANEGASISFYAYVDAVSETYLTRESLNMCYKMFGINKVLGIGEVPSADNVPVIEAGTSVNVADSLRFHTVSITSRIFHTSSIDSNQADVGDQHVLAKIPTNAPFGSMILFKGNLKDGYLLRLPKLNAVDLALRDHNGDLINLNGARFNVSLLAQFIKRNDYTPIPKDIAPAIDYKNFIRRRLAVGRRRRGR